MTRKNAKALLPIIAAYAEGKTIEFLTTYDNKWEELKDANFIHPADQYRIKPEPKLVPMTSDDLPPALWVRRKNKTISCVYHSVKAIDPEDGQIWYGTTSSFRPSEYAEWEWSSDRKTWHSFMKEINE